MEHRYPCSRDFDPNSRSERANRVAREILQLQLRSVEGISNFFSPELGRISFAACIEPSSKSTISARCTFRSRTSFSQPLRPRISRAKAPFAAIEAIQTLGMDGNRFSSLAGSFAINLICQYPDAAGYFWNSRSRHPCAPSQPNKKFLRPETIGNNWEQSELRPFPYAA